MDDEKAIYCEKEKAHAGETCRRQGGFHEGKESPELSFLTVHCRYLLLDLPSY